MCPPIGRNSSAVEIWITNAFRLFCAIGSSAGVERFPCQVRTPLSVNFGGLKDVTIVETFHTNPLQWKLQTRDSKIRNEIPYLSLSRKYRYLLYAISLEITFVGDFSRNKTHQVIFSPKSSLFGPFLKRFRGPFQ